MVDITVSRDIAAPADDVWALVADVTRMGEWSPEATGGVWTKGASGPVVGAAFKGTNARGGRTWSTACKVTDCTPGEIFSFDVTAGPLKVSRWDYWFETTDDGCRVTEAWTDQRGWLVKTLGERTTGVEDRFAHNRANIEATLEALARAVTG